MRAILHIVSLFYLVLIRIRLLGYRFKLLKQHVFDTPIISIGNITVGGTGKTPMVIYFSQLLTKQNIKHAIVSRGYKKTARGTTVVQDYNKRHVNDPVFAGDEPIMLTYKLTNIPIIVDSNKARGIATTIEKFNPEIILLDDGFQSLYIDKKRDCVLIDCSLSVQEYQLMPRGRLREPLVALGRSDFVFFMKKGVINDAIKENILPILNQHTIPYIDASFESTLYQHNYNSQSLERCDDYSEKHHYKKMVNLPCVAISGIGNAGPFIDEANKFCYVCDTWSAPDHYNYKKNEDQFDTIVSLFDYENRKGKYSRIVGDDEKKIGIITTLKDYVKIVQLSCVQLKKHSLYVVDIDVVTNDDNRVLESILRKG